MAQHFSNIFFALGRARCCKRYMKSDGWGIAYNFNVCLQQYLLHYYQMHSFNNWVDSTTACDGETYLGCGPMERHIRVMDRHIRVGGRQINLGDRGQRSILGE